MPRLGPTFFLIGAAKSGTTAVASALGRHPDVFISDPKEPHYFAYLADRRVAGHLYPDPAGAERQYRALFAGVKGEQAVGDASTTNLSVPGTADRIAEAVPDAAIVAVLRHPVDRAYSHFLHFVAAGAESTRDFREAVALEGERRAGGWPHTYSYTAWSRYGELLAPFVERFGPARLLVHLYDDLVADPAAVVRSTLAFVGVDPGGAPPVVERRNVVAVPRVRLVDDVLAGRNRAGRALRRALPARAHARLRAVARNRLSWRPPLDPAVRAQLTRRFDDDLDRLEVLLGRDLSAWRA